MPAPLRSLNKAELEDLAARTVTHYEDGAESFWQATRDHDVTQNIDALLRALPQALAGSDDGERRVLDVGCGPGRDLVTFTERGFAPTGVDGCLAFVDAARARASCDVWQQGLLALSLPSARFHGVFCNASLFHVPTQELPRVLIELLQTLVPGGALLCSIPHGDDVEGFRGNRYGSYLRPATWRAYFGDAGFVLVEDYFRPTDKPPAEQPWYVSVWRRPLA